MAVANNWPTKQLIGGAKARQTTSEWSAHRCQGKKKIENALWRTKGVTCPRDRLLIYGPGSTFFLKHANKANNSGKKKETQIIGRNVPATRQRMKSVATNRQTPRDAKQRMGRRMAELKANYGNKTKGDQLKHVLYHHQRVRIIHQLGRAGFATS